MEYGLKKTKDIINSDVIMLLFYHVAKLLRLLLVLSARLIILYMVYILHFMNIHGINEHGMLINYLSGLVIDYSLIFFYN